MTFLRLLNYSGLLFAMSFSVQAEKNDPPLFSFGAIADCQYCNVESKGRRKYNLSDRKLKASVEHLNRLELDFVVHLGDFIDKDFESFEVVGPIYNQLKAPHYHVLGNHDFSVADDKKKMVPAAMGLDKKYYAYQVKGWRFIVLDGNDISFHAYPKNSPGFKQAQKYYEERKVTSPKWNGAVGPEQLVWVKKNLEQATRKKESVVFFCHFPVYPANVHNLWNADEVLETIAPYPCVKAYINGHNHAGNYGEKNQVHFLTLQGMVDTEETAYSMIEVFSDRLKVKGYGREKDRVLSLKP